MKLFIVCFYVLLVFCNSSKFKDNNLLNKYKDLKNPFGSHSLFSGHNGENVSNYYLAVPPPIPEKQLFQFRLPTPKFATPESSVAKILVELYRKRFDYLDAININDLVDAQELSIAYKDFDWPKSLTDVSDNDEYAKTIIEKYDKERKGGMNFVDFCLFMEDLWDISDAISEAKCGTGFDKAMEVWDGFFKWLDRDNDSFLVMEDMIYGISKMMYRDVDLEEVKLVFAEYGGAEKKISYDSFVLAIANGLLTKSLSDPNMTETLNSQLTKNK